MRPAFRTLLALLGLTSLALAAPARAGTGDVRSLQAVATTEAKLKEFAFAQRAEFGALVKSLGRQSEADLAELTANYNEMDAAPERRAAVESVRTARADFNDKVDTLDNVAVETWDNTKSNIITSWKHLEETLHQARAQRT